MKMTHSYPAFQNFDVLVLGAGIIGVCTALHLQQRGSRVCLLDRQEPGSGTSFGNAGLIERSSVIPYAFPQQAMRLLRYALNRQSDVYYRPLALPGLMRWLWQYWRNSAPGALARAAHDMLPLIERSIQEHRPLIEAAGAQALIREEGWIDVYRSVHDWAQAAREAQAIASTHGLRVEILDASALKALEPGVLSTLVGGIHWMDPWTITSPGDLVKAYTGLFQSRGGDFIHGDAQAISRTTDGWCVPGADGTSLNAAQVVVALGPESDQLLRALGYRFPLAFKRGYHLHYQPVGQVPDLERPICDSAGGYVLSQMRQGIRLTTGVELARADAAPSRTQIDRAHALAKTIFPLGAAIEIQPWMGRRPCLPDMRPIIGPAPHDKGLWLNIGHAHHGITLGPVCGRLLAEMMTGSPCSMDPSPYSATRFS